jgi:hypothetical protein
MQRLEVIGAARLIYRSLGVKGLTIDMIKGFEYQGEQFRFVRFITLRNIHRVLAVYFASYILIGGGGPPHCLWPCRRV